MTVHTLAPAAVYAKSERSVTNVIGRDIVSNERRAGWVYSSDLYCKRANEIENHLLAGPVAKTCGESVQEMKKLGVDRVLRNKETKTHGDMETKTYYIDEYPLRPKSIPLVRTKSQNPRAVET